MRAWGLVGAMRIVFTVWWEKFAGFSFSSLAGPVDWGSRLQHLAVGGGSAHGWDEALAGMATAYHFRPKDEAAGEMLLYPDSQLWATWPAGGLRLCMNVCMYDECVYGCMWRCVYIYIYGCVNLCVYVCVCVNRSVYKFILREPQCWGSYSPRR